MGVFNRLLRPQQRQAEQRGAISAYVLEALAGTPTTAGVSVTPESALGYSAVLACVRVLGEGVAQLPLLLYERQARGRRRAVDHPLADLLHTAPNAWITSFEWRELMMAHLALWGNAFCEIERDGAGRPVALWPLMPWSMTVHERASGERWYEYELPNMEKRPLRAEQVLHVPGFGYDGLSGRSLIRLSRESVGLGVAAQRYGATVFGNGEVPGGVLEHPGQLSDGAFERLRQSWSEQHQGLTSANRLAILEEGMKYSKTGIPPEDAQFLETRRFQRTEIAAIFRVPPHMIGDLERATFSNIEQQSLDFVIYTLGPWLTRIEQRLGMALLSRAERSRYYAEFLVAGLLRGDIQSRYQAYATARQWGWMSANDVRALENLNPVDGGDAYLTPMNMVEAEGLQGPSTNEKTNKRMGDVEKDPALRVERRAASDGSGRRRLAEAQRPALQDVAQRILNRETNDIGNAARRLLAKSPEEFGRWLREFLAEHREFVKRKLWPTVWSVALLAGDEARREAAEARAEGEMDDAALELYTRGVVSGWATGWCEKLRVNVEDQVGEAQAAGEDAAQAVEAALQRRREGEAESWARDQSTGIVNAAAIAVFTAVGVLTLRWMTSGKESCPYCEMMDGRTVGILEFFVPLGGEVAPEGHQPLRPHRNTRHPPLHDGCDCVVVPG